LLLVIAVAVAVAAWSVVAGGETKAVWSVVTGVSRSLFVVISFFSSLWLLSL
jgi:hypothetical protein